MDKPELNANQDKIFAQEQEKIAPFSFDQKVVDVFPDMINRSVPGYKVIIESVPQLMESSLTKGSLVYDIGCSLGASSLSIARAYDSQPIKIKAIDYSSAMVEKCRRNVSAYHLNCDVEVIQADISTLELDPCDAVVMNFTLQFIQPDLRDAIINKIFNALNPGGILILSEKLSFSCEQVNNKLVDLHHNFKRQNGYSELEISQKRTALENVMITDTLETHYARLNNAGFQSSSLWFQYYNFASIMALK